MDLNKYLKTMVKHEASDLYMTTGSPPLLKINAKMVAVGKETLAAGQTREIAEGVMNDEQQSEFSKLMEMNLGYTVDGLGRFRVNIFQQRGEVGLVFRRIQDVIPSFKELGLPNVLKKLVMKKQGLVLVVGGTGCGKSTTLASMIEYRNKHTAGHIVTIEDPIEFVYKHRRSIVSQREIGMDTTSYEEALKNTLRQVPSVILIGEVRDYETMQKALQFSETGHLCLSTLHANNASQALERIVNLFPEESAKRVRLDLALNLKAIVSQRLLENKKDGKRVAAFEVLIATARVKDLIKEGKFAEIKDVLAKENNAGMQSLDNDIYRLFKEGEITEKEAIDYADSDSDMRVKMDMTSGDATERGDDLSIDGENKKPS